MHVYKRRIPARAPAQMLGAGVNLMQPAMAVLRSGLGVRTTKHTHTHTLFWGERAAPICTAEAFAAAVPISAITKKKGGEVL